MNRKVFKISAYALLVGSMLFCGVATSVYGSNKKARKAKTVVINTIESGKGVKGFAGPVPVEMTVSGGRIAAIRPLQNHESPGYFKLVTESGLLKKFIGLTPKKAAELKVDAVSGATYSSKALIENVRIAAREAAKR